MIEIKTYVARGSDHFIVTYSMHSPVTHVLLQQQALHINICLLHPDQKPQYAKPSLNPLCLPYPVWPQVHWLLIKTLIFKNK